MNRIIEWFNLRIYRRLVLSHISILFLFFVCCGILIRFGYNPHVRELFGKRFQKQTAFRVRHFQDRINSYQGLLSPNQKLKTLEDWRTYLLPMKKEIQTFIEESSLLLGSLIIVKNQEQQVLFEGATPKDCNNSDFPCLLSRKIKKELHKQWQGTRSTPLVLFFSPKDGKSLLFNSNYSKRYQIDNPIFTFQLPNQEKLQLTFYWLFPGKGIELPLNIFIILMSFFVFIALFSSSLSKRLSAPLLQLIDIVRGMEKGEFEQPIRQLKLPGEIGELASAIEKMRRSLQDLTQQRKDLLADFSHEIRTPLSRIRTVAECAADGIFKSPEKLKHNMEGLCQQVDEVNLLLQDLLELGKSDLIELQTIEQDETPVKKMVEEVLQAFRTVAERESIQVIELFSQSDFPLLLMDSRRIRQALTNLLENALRHSPPNGKITLKVVEEITGIRFIVSDQGPGVPKEDRERIFERLVRLDPSRSRKTGGQGLGLAIVSKIISAHDGEVGVTEAIGGGASFWFHLPRKKT